ncbi:uncharacterized protein M421DRAFT_217476 [Didymella exigua CBS 183.55]|uniref:HAUS augmin-like complex subunit 6 N-terminal domain-containing protein n=1 Tax=Didymella exigua CBS 183.55 TaxID=1150837 RepID=A0A6A5RH87_9PLEO|nr:uncharacterized protein M421DRAFT_217476 [Didymella exigua CBS 183.55]KAF1926488.1 hypothetical protein M421DRAFT_217476 [Didymella exigua CBS 183.55]
MSRPPSQASSAAASTRPRANTIHPTTTTTAATAATAATTTNPLPASHARRFVTNLRLLGFDGRDDWPHPTAQTFAARNADQKQRIAATEWALFRLFDLWDPAETAQKLRPFFPPLEPLQSRNLRAALYRWLAELKKTGVLGREAVLRKTMLDECKGDRFLEVLALFSAAVLRRTLASRRGRSGHAAIARRLAAASTLSADEQRALLPLAVAHRAALASVLRRKDDKRAQFARFAATLHSKAGDISRRTRPCDGGPGADRPPVPQREADALKRQLADNWIGDRQWLGVMLHGHQPQPADAFLGTRFDSVWRMVGRGRRLEDAAPEASLLDDLQSRVREQQTRLQRWTVFHEQLRRHNTKGASASPKPLPLPLPRASDFTFDTHAQHQLPSARDVERRVVQRPALPSAYRDILSDMDAELSRVSQSHPQPAPASLRRGRASSGSAARSPVRARVPSDSWHTEPKTLVGEPRTLVGEPKTLVREQKALFEGLSAANASAHPQRRPSAKATPVDSDAARAGQLPSLRIAAPPSLPAVSPTRRRVQHPPRAEPAPVPHGRAASSSSLPSEDSAPSLPSEDSAPSQPTPFSETASTSPPEYSRSVPSLDIAAPDRNEQLLADEIINAIGNATPSPVKRPQPRMSLSLVDRTRMTLGRTPSVEPRMALGRTPSFEPVHESPDPLPVAPPAAAADAALERTASLLDRTRQSIAASSRRHASTTKQRTSRESVVSAQPDAPCASLDALDALGDQGGSGTRTPREHLLAADIDYDRVFRSRPRIATSPVFSPEKYAPDEDEDITGIDLHGVDASDTDDGFSQTLDASPSQRVRRVRY